MRIFEITSDSRKAIKQLRKLYMEYVFDKSKFDDLHQFIYNAEKSNDQDLIREARIIFNAVDLEILRILSK
jgi:hypothetical protein